jgi:nucleoside-diphosphate-sugar epimerase
MPASDERQLLCFGHGYVAQHLARALGPDWQVTGTSRTQRSLPGARIVTWPGDDILPALGRASHILSSVPPDQGGDPVLDVIAAQRHRLSPHLRWLALLSTTGVYGDQGGAWVAEDAPIVPAGHRGALRAAQEVRWFDLHRDHGLPVHVFRLAGIYGPGRSAFDRLRDGTARRIIKPGQVFSRIHVDDIVAILRASMAAPTPGEAFNLADDLPAPTQDVIAEAARLAGLPVPPDEPFDTADMTPMARSFYADNKRVANGKVKRTFGITLLHPDYHSGLRAILAKDR